MLLANSADILPFLTTARTLHEATPTTRPLH